MKVTGTSWNDQGCYYRWYKYQYPSDDTSHHQDTDTYVSDMIEKFPSQLISALVTPSLRNLQGTRNHLRTSGLFFISLSCPRL